MQANISKCNLPLSLQDSHFLQPHTDTPHILFSGTDNCSGLCSIPTQVAFGVTLAYPPSVISITIQRVPLMSHGFHTSPTSFCANCYSLPHCHNFLNYYIISYNLVTCWTEKETQLTCSTSFINKYEIKLVPLLKKFPKSHYGNSVGS